MMAARRLGPHRLAATILRPMPPAFLLEDEAVAEPRFLPAPELDAWARASFIGPEAPLHNPDHAHLEHARIGWLWTSVPNRRQMRSVAGTAEIPHPPQNGGAWARARWEMQLRTLFPVDGPTYAWKLPDFVITLFAPYAAAVDDPAFCAFVEHELYHCAQAEDEFGTPVFYRDSGLPKFAIRGHDAEEHIGVVRRYGPGSAAGGVGALVEAASRRPEIAAVSIAGVCGTCRRAA